MCTRASTGASGDLRDTLMVARRSDGVLMSMKEPGVGVMHITLAVQRPQLWTEQRDQGLRYWATVSWPGVDPRLAPA